MHAAGPFALALSARLSRGIFYCALPLAAPAVCPLLPSAHVDLQRLHEHTAAPRISVPKPFVGVACSGARVQRRPVVLLPETPAPPFAIAVADPQSPFVAWLLAAVVPGLPPRRLHAAGPFALALSAWHRANPDA